MRKSKAGHEDVFARLLHDSTIESDLFPPEQQAIRDKCMHPTGEYIVFPPEALDHSIPDRFEQQVNLYPDRLAVQTQHNKLTYESLNKLANRVAHTMLTKYGESTSPVALLMSEGCDAVAGSLGLLKAGKICVPIDPALPLSRLQSNLMDAQADVILTTTADLELSRELSLSTCSVVNLDTDTTSAPDTNPALTISPDTLAYILYTSGSTGQPKGVMGTHLQLLHTVRTHTNTFHMCQEDRRTLLESFCSTGTWGDVFGALLNGAAILPFNLKAEGFTSFARWLDQEAITIYSSVPTVFRHFARALTEQDRFPTLRLVRLGGEPIYQEDVHLFQTICPKDCVLLTNLGSTEAGSIRHYFIDTQVQFTERVVPAGYAIEGKDILILSEDRMKTTDNRIGEIAVRSPYLSPGYWRQVTLTSETFVSDPDDPAYRIYLTGDLGQMRSDGCLDYLGRQDSQVKIRGFRVELGEIETVLAQHPAILQTAVQVQGGDDPEAFLIAYLVVDDGLDLPTVTSLREFLSLQLPTYMVPSRFVLLGSLPLTHSGKLDRIALLQPQKLRPILDVPYAAPRTPIESKLAELWSELLELDQVGIHDSFFELGGHSLLASQLCSRVVETFRANIPLRSLFETSTIAQMAVVITQHLVANADPAVVTRLLDDIETGCISE